MRGRLLPGLVATVELVGVDAPSNRVRSDSLEPDGRFYFRNVPAGEYVLSVTAWVEGTGRNLYYPGTYDRQKAARLRITNHALAGGRTLDFNSETFPIVPIPIALDPPGDSGRFSWRVQFLRSSYVISEEMWTPGGKLVVPYGMRGTSYEILLFGWSNRPAEYGNCRSESKPVVAKPGMATIHIAVPANCQ